MRTSRQQAGDAAEAAVVDQLVRAGWTILARQVHAGRAELDIVAIDPGPPRELVIVEVRWRRSRAFGTAEESVDHRKRAHLRDGAWRWLEASAGPRLPVRFDLAVVEPSGDPDHPRIRHHRAAF